MMKVFDGKKKAQKIRRDLKAEIIKAKVKPVLAIILVGDDESSKLYVKLKKDAGKKVGIEVLDFRFESGAPESDILNKISELNTDPKVSGIIVQLPLPGIFNTDKIISAISPEKDVDGFHKHNLKMLEKGKNAFSPVLPLALLTAAQDALKKELPDKSFLAIINSEIFGQGLKAVFEKAGVKNFDCQIRNTCIVFGSERELKSADVLITVCGCPNLIKGEMIKEGAVLIDGGITRYHDGKVVGDVDKESVKSRASFLTPVPGGIGPLTVALLLRNVFLAAVNQKQTSDK